MYIKEFYEMILDNLTEGIYILDNKGNYIFVNDAYVQLLNMPKQLLLTRSVYDFLKSGEVSISVADIVYREKRRVVMFQDVFDTQKFGRRTLRMLVVSNPVFDNSGNVQNIISMVQPLDTMEKLYKEASKSEVISQIIQFDSSAVGTNQVIVSSSAMLEVLTTAAMVAKVDAVVLIGGESGTGKEVVANYIHQNSTRSGKQMIIINCAALPANLLEAELFGYEKGAFTGALLGGKMGMIEAASGSTLFLDEINSLSLDLQSKLLRAIETKAIRRIGSTKSVDVDFRLLAATNESLQDMVERKEFRADLYYRLNVIPIDVPPLRQRREDIIPLANHFLQGFCAKHGKHKFFTQRSLDKIWQYDWPGNVRELKNCVERFVVISTGGEIEISGVTKGKNASIEPISIGSVADSEFVRLMQEGVTLRDYLEQCERNYLSWVLEHAGSTYKAAEILGTSQSSVMRRKQKHNL